MKNSKQNNKTELGVLVKLLAMLLVVAFITFVKVDLPNPTTDYMYLQTVLTSFGPILAFGTVLILSFLVNSDNGEKRLKFFDIMLSLIAFVFTWFSPLILSVFK